MPKTCEFGNCKGRAMYGFNNDKVFCKEHKEEGMKYYNKKCKCNKQPVFNYPDENTAICCATCKQDGMIDVKNKKCKCNKHPLFNYPDENTPICCATCKEDGMVDIKNKKCKCNKRPYYNYPDQTTAICCVSCKLDGMVDVSNKKCKCNKRPIFNYPDQTIAICCSNCKEDGMVDIIHKKCKCNKEPKFNYPDQTTAICCANCKEDGMVDIKNKKCKNIGCETRSNRKYNNYCSNCFQHLFPTDPLTFQIRSKTKEIAVRDFINENYEGFCHDKPLYTSHCDCTIRRRIDHRILIDNTLLCIETDENQHNSYDKMDEEIRYNDLYNAYSGKWIYIRFNPDIYYVDGKKKNDSIATRLGKLKQEIDKQIERIKKEENKELLEIVYMYYNKR